MRLFYKKSFTIKSDKYLLLLQYKIYGIYLNKRWLFDDIYNYVNDINNYNKTKEISLLLGFSEIEIEIDIIKEHIKNHFRNVKKSLSNSRGGKSNIKKK